MGLGPEHWLICGGGRVEAGVGQRQSLVHGLWEGLAGKVGLDGAAALRPRRHGALVDNAASVHQSWGHWRGHERAAALRKVQLSCGAQKHLLMHC